MKKFLFITICAFAFLSATAQKKENNKAQKKEARQLRINAISRQEEEGVLTYTKHFLAGAKLTTDGYGGFLEIGRAKSVKKAFLFQLEITEKKNPKEDKFFDPSRTVESIIYGKINYFYPVKIGVQQQFLLGNKGNKNGVSVTANIGGGLIAGLLRPYKVQVEKGNGDREYIGYDSPDSTLFLTGPYYAAPGLGTGWNSLKVTPGIYLKPALRFDYGKYNEVISALEVGVIAEYYSKAIPQLVYVKQDKFFFSAYVSILFGKRK